jgi:peptide/nickel transport system permease protein
MRYAGGRLLHAVLLLFAVSLISFAMANLAPGDYFSALQAESRYSAETIEGLRARAGLDRPFAVRYADWAASMLRGDFGYSLAYNGPVAPLVGGRLRNTVLLTGCATFLAWLLAVPLGIWNASRRGRWPDTVSRVLLSLLMAIPDLLLAIVLLALAASTGWFPVGGMESRASTGRWGDLAWHLALPVAVLVTGMLPVLARHVRASMVEMMESPFALNARAQGIPRRRLLFHHVLPAALNPLISLFGLSLGGLLSASLLIEVVMGWPGLGPLFLDAIMNRDFAIVLAVVMLAAAFLIGGNLVADLLLYRLDPRIRARPS